MEAIWTFNFVTILMPSSHSIVDINRKMKQGPQTISNRASNLKPSKDYQFPLLETLKSVHITYRQIGTCEATYQLHELHLKDSIRTTIPNNGFSIERISFRSGQTMRMLKNTVEIEGAKTRTSGL